MKWRNKRRLAGAQRFLWMASDLLENIHLDAQLYYAASAADWQEGPEGAHYHSQMRSVCELTQILRGLTMPEVGALR